MRAKATLSPIRVAKLIIALALVAGLSALSAFQISQSSAGSSGAVPPGMSSRATGNDAQSDVAVEGWVKDENGSPISGAEVTLASARAVSDASGYFSFSNVLISRIAGSAQNQPARLDLTVSSLGHAAWSISQARYYAGDTLRVYPRLADAGHAATHLTAAQPHLVNSSRPINAPLDLAASGRPQSVAPAVEAAAKSAASNLPAQIRVYRTATGQVDVVPFEDYVKHVLPNEWVSTWGSNSLRAGAMAVKEYAWFWISQGGKQAALGADVRDDTDDQVYDPNVSYASTDAAVDATWPYAMTRNGALFQASYCAGSYQADPSIDCPWDGNYMTQWGSKYYSDQGYSWSWILRFYYPGSVVTPTPPGGDGGPVPTRLPGPTTQPAPVPVSGSFTVGQGSNDPQLFQDAYQRNGGAAGLGQPTGAVHWWMQYVSEHNVLAQPLSGADGHGNTWIVFDTLKSDISGIKRAYVLTGQIASAYASHNPPGPEWVGAPTSDAYRSSADTLSQGFASGTLSVNGQDVQFTPWPTQFNGWEADYFVGTPPSSVQTGPVFDLPGQPANVIDAPQPDINWPASAAIPKTVGAGGNDWSVQFTRVMQVSAGSYDIVVSADSGVRLWIDGLLAVNAWSANGSHSEKYNADLDATPHTIRIQYFSPNSGGQLSFSMSERGQALPAPTTAPVPTPGNQPGSSPTGASSLRITTTWLGRGSAPSDQWVQPLELLLSKPGDPTIVGTYSGTTDRNGVAIYDNLPSGVYDVHVKGTHTLQSARASIALASGTTTSVDMKAMVEGDLDGDNCVTIDDFKLIQGMIGADSGTPGYDPRADLNGDGKVTAADVSLLRSGFDHCGDVSADNDLYAMSADGSPTFAELLTPWLDAGSLQKNLQLALYSSATTVRVGDTVQVQVVANVGSQPIDGGSFLLHYDVSLLSPVDSNGNPATLSEPGVALPSVLTNWVDSKGGAIGYAAGMLQGDAPSGQVVLTTLNFKALRPGQAQLQFAPLLSGYMELTNGGTNLLGSANDFSLTVTP